MIDLTNLKYFVLCKSTLAFFETIAAFDCRPAAVNYMVSCATCNPRHTYKIEEHV